VGFAQPHPAVDEQRIISFAGLRRHRHGGGVGKAIAVPDYETD
jgi:hypothetical protein